MLPLVVACGRSDLLLDEGSSLPDAGSTGASSGSSGEGHESGPGSGGNGSSGRSSSGAGASSGAASSSGGRGVERNGGVEWGRVVRRDRIVQWGRHLSEQRRRGRRRLGGRRRRCGLRPGDLRRSCCANLAPAWWATSTTPAAWEESPARAATLKSSCGAHRHLRLRQPAPAPPWQLAACGHSLRPRFPAPRSPPWATARVSLRFCKLNFPGLAGRVQDRPAVLLGSRPQSC